MTDETIDPDVLRRQGVSEDKIKWFLDMQAMRNEELLPELQEHVYESEHFGRMLKHPLVFQIPLMVPGDANRAYRYKKAELADALAEEDLHRVIWLHERAYRLDALLEYVIGRDEYGDPVALVDVEQETRDYAADVWVDSENINQHVEDWAGLFAGWECGDPMLFNDDPEGWAALPDVLTVYRAGIDDGGWSWTLDRKVAEFFARRFGAGHEITEGSVRKDCVFGYLTRRSEAEVLVPDGSVDS